MANSSKFWTFRTSQTNYFSNISTSASSSPRVPKSLRWSTDHHQFRLPLPPTQRQSRRSLRISAHPRWSCWHLHPQDRLHRLVRQQSLYRQETWSQVDGVDHRQHRLWSVYMRKQQWQRLLDTCLLSQEQEQEQTPSDLLSQKITDCRQLCLIHESGWGFLTST